MLSLSLPRTAVRTVFRTASASNTRYNSTRYYSSTMHDNDPQVLETEKQRNLSGTQHRTSTPHEHAPGWNEALASASEASVKADKATGTPAEMQARTVEYIKTRHADPDNREESTSAFYARDEVSGPLSGARGKEEVLVHEDRVILDKELADSVAREIKEDQMTPSEEDVKADRGEI